MNKNRIFLVDDHDILREGLRFIIQKEEDFIICGEAAKGEEALENIDKTAPDIVVLDISLPEMSGIEVAKNILKKAPDLPILILTRHDSEDYIKTLFQIGVKGYVLKKNTSSDLIKAIRAVLKGELYVSSNLTELILESFAGKEKNQKSSIPLSTREIEILRLIAEGLSGADIALKLKISENTVRNHRANIMNKLNMRKSTELVKYAIKNGILPR